MYLALNALLLSLLLIFGFATTPHRSIIVSYPDDTPDSVLTEAIQAVKQAGGTISHEYKLIKAFAAQAPEDAVRNVQLYGSKYNAIIEDDQQVHAYGDGF